ncbi:MAG TPA: DUF3877 family protein [Lachnospiraceae bacterium]
MEIKRFKKNIMEQIKEAQLKLGYSKETMRLYYPLPSLNAILQSDYQKIEDMQLALESAFLQEEELGKVKFAVHKKRLEVTISPQGVEYVGEHYRASSFLKEMIDLFNEDHHCNLEKIKTLFAKHDKNYICQKMPKGEDFDYVFYFENPEIDDYYYCIKEEMGHTIYHRFSKEDYELLLT